MKRMALIAALLLAAILAYGAIQPPPQQQTPFGEDEAMAVLEQDVGDIGPVLPEDLPALFALNK